MLWILAGLGLAFGATQASAQTDSLARDSVPALPRIAVIPRDVLTDRVGRYFSGGATLVLRAGRNYLYAEANALEVPTTVMFFPEDRTNFPEDRTNFTGLDPATRKFTRLHFILDDGQGVVIDLANGNRVEGRR